MPRKPPRRTRERILATALALFNRDGAPHVTTADIADEMNISPGNLYYHFRSKDEIVGELYDAHEAALAPLLDVPADRALSVEDLWLMLHLLFERMGDYRFLYRDLDEIASRTRRLGQRLAAHLARLERAFGAVLAGLERAGELAAGPAERRALARNIVLVATYWMSFQRMRRGPIERATDALDPGEAAWHILALTAPFLAADGRRLFERLSADYL
jgi:AcrR family transcriptional regulator